MRCAICNYEMSERDRDESAGFLYVDGKPYCLACSIHVANAKSLKRIKPPKYDKEAAQIWWAKLSKSLTEQGFDVGRPHI